MNIFKSEKYKVGSCEPYITVLVQWVPIYDICTI